MRIFFNRMRYLTNTLFDYFCYLCICLTSCVRDTLRHSSLKITASALHSIKHHIKQPTQNER